MQREAKSKTQHGGHKGVQERISFLKMEYFLYAFGETHRIVREIRLLGEYVKKCDNDIEVLDK